MAKAVSDCAFTTSSLPVILSLEMHCSPENQHRLAQSMVKHIRSALFVYSDLVATKRATSLSPLDLNNCVLVKGKVKEGGKKVEKKGNFCRRLSASMTAAGVAGASSDRRSGRLDKLESSTRLAVAPSAGVHASVVDKMAACRKQLDKRLVSSMRPTDKFYASLLALRSEPIATFRNHLITSKWELPISSINEDGLLTELGLPIHERYEIEGLLTGRSQADAALSLTEEQQTSRAIVRLAANPPLQVGRVQRRTAEYLLRPYPLGLRLSGKNMSPLPCWLAGAQHVCLNFSDNDLVNGQRALEPHALKH